MRIPLINSREWNSIAPLLPPPDGPGKPRLDDRLMLSALYYAAATRCSLDSLPPAYGNPRSLRTQRQRWQADGTLTRLMEAGVPVIERMRRGYLGLILDASSGPSKSGEFFGHGVIPRKPYPEPRGRYAPRRREPAG